MKGKEKRSQSHKNILPVIGVVLALLLAGALLWHGNATSNQALPAMVAQVYFAGEYQVADGPWQEIVVGILGSVTTPAVSTQITLPAL